jgi:transposase
MTPRRRHELSDAQWQTLKPLLPPQRPARGRPNRPHRTILNGILWRLNTGAPWRDLPARYGSWMTVYSRFRRWQRAGVWDRILAALQAAGDAAGQLDWSIQFLDATIVRAHVDAAGAKRGADPKPSAAVPAASPPSSICGPKGAANRSASR